MQISLVLFPNAPDNISALVFESHADERCWQRHYHPFAECNGGHALTEIC